MKSSSVTEYDSSKMSLSVSLHNYMETKILCVTLKIVDNCNEIDNYKLMQN